MSNRLELLKATLRRERAGLVSELELKRHEIEELEKTLRTLDAVIGGGERPAPEPIARRRNPYGSGGADLYAQEKDSLREAIIAVLKEAPDGLAAETLTERLKPRVQTREPLESRRISMLCRQMEKRGEGIIGDSTCWLYVPDEEESKTEE